MLPLLTATNGFSAARALEVNGFGDEFLAGSALALNQHRASARCDLRHEIENLEDLFALSDDVAVAEAFSKRATQMRVFAHQLPLLDGVADDHEKLFVVPGLGDVVEAAFLDCGYCGFDSRHRRNDDDRQGWIDSLDVLLNVHSGLSGQHQIQQDEIVEVLFDLAQAFLAVVRRLGGHPFGRQKHLDAFANLLLIVNDQDISFALRHSQPFLKEGIRA